MKKLLSSCLALLGVAGVLCACVGPGSSPVAPPGSSQNESGARPGVPAPVAALPNTHPLTGRQTEAGFTEDRRPLAVMVDNSRLALPQRGVAAADLTFEMVTEGGITRLMCVYGDAIAAPEVGPVRSARDQHVQMMIPMAALYLHVGGSTHAGAMLADYGWDNKDIDGNRYSALALAFDAERRAAGARPEQCWFSSGEHVRNTLENSELDAVMAPGAVRGPVFHFVPYDEPPRAPEGGEAKDIYVRFSGYANAAFSFDEASGRYVKSAFGGLQVDENTGEAVAYDNLLILFTDISKYPDGVLAKVDFALNGVGFYCSGGRYEPVRWLKGAPEAPLRILQGDGSETDILVNPGTSYVAFVGLEEYEYFKIEGAPETSGAREDDQTPGPGEGEESPDEGAAAGGMDEAGGTHVQPGSDDGAADAPPQDASPSGG